jgi:hypothetical protein
LGHTGSSLLQAPTKSGTLTNVVAMAAAPKPMAEQREKLLDSWKEIAVFLNRGVRTVQRWEREESLPVHRHNHGKRGTVFAFPSEIEHWMRSRDGIGNSSLTLPMNPPPPRFPPRIRVGTAVRRSPCQSAIRSGILAAV